ncbi:hypothetical protein I6F35_23065 [Bradyrhizobium sp. BRP22]|uniref:hypothetical protein n=1 Tax=Bradyrhizobium sp. BRP22 TaxID=2793821 RepID=UPI001CD4CB1B|nr:hypothetical protein [Bradyrhizobium sp. BRP22]MCA1456051.1 hypothetical protein [Bradyrhizobium sp. BRP22]
MTEQSERDAAAKPLATDAISGFTKANKYAFSLLEGTGNALFDEMLFVGNEIVDRAVAETAIFNEFLSKLAEAHSVRDLGAMYQECTRHQLDFIRRDTERLLKHSQRVIDNTAKLVETWQQN